MKPQLVVLEPRSATSARPGCDSLAQDHLTDLQFGELLAGTTTPGAQSDALDAHILTCEQCAAEVALLRESLSFFRLASSAYADSELRHIPQVKLPSRRIFSPVTASAWWIAAAAIFLVSLLPMQSVRLRPSPAPPTVSASSPSSTYQSDEALLEGVDRDTSASIPAPMQTLADPTGSNSSAVIDPSVPTSIQR